LLVFVFLMIAIGHLDFFLWKISVQLICPFPHQVIEILEV
jgi:hypothetical protein